MFRGCSCVLGVFLCFGSVPVFGVVPVFRRRSCMCFGSVPVHVFMECSCFSEVFLCFGGVPVFRECSGVPVFRCSGVLVFLVLIHAVLTVAHDLVKHF